MNLRVLLVGVAIVAIVLGVLVTAQVRVRLGLYNPNEIRSPMVGKLAPAFVLREVGTGRLVDVSQLKGKPVVINFWATWCGPCWEEHPVLVANAKLTPEVQFLGVVFQDTEEKILGFLQQRGSSYPTVVDDKGKTAIAYGVGGVPETYFLDANGVIVAKFSGPLQTDVLQANIRKAFHQ